MEDQQGSGEAGQAGQAEVTRLLRQWRGGDREALDALLPLVYAELRRLARRSLRRQPGERTLQPTALVAEAYLRLVDVDVPWNDRVHFYAVAATLMRNILVAAARRRHSRKRGGDGRPLSLDQLVEGGLEIAGPEAGSPILQLDQALIRLAAFDPRKARVVELRCFAGLSISETAAAMDLSHATVERDLKVAKAWLTKELAGSPAAAVP